jgi:hypothetical protein
VSGTSSKRIGLGRVVGVTGVPRGSLELLQAQSARQAISCVEIRHRIIRLWSILGEQSTESGVCKGAKMQNAHTNELDLYLRVPSEAGLHAVTDSQSSQQHIPF